MAVYFFDSSALLKRYFAENGTDLVLGIIDSGETVVVSRLAAVEVASASARRFKAGDIDQELLDSTFAASEEDFRGLFQVIEISPAIIAAGIDIVRRHSLRAADAVQLASAMRGTGGPTNDSKPILVTSDLELNVAAQSEGLTVLDPQQD